MRPLKGKAPVRFRERCDDHARDAPPVKYATELLARDPAVAEPEFLQVITQLLGARGSARKEVLREIILPCVPPREIHHHGKGEVRGTLGLPAALVSHERG